MPSPPLSTPSAGTGVGVRRRVALVGAGRIADTHAQALKEIGRTELAAVIDPTPGRADALGRKWGFAGAFTSLADARADGGFDCAHVLVPPPLHRRVAEECAAAGLDVLVEKPLAETDADCAGVQAAARAAGVALHINQNSIFQPAHLRMKAVADARTLGPLRHLAVHFSMPLPQLAMRQFGHWMFQSPRNLLLEQAVHPLAQIDDLLGPVIELAVTAPPAHQVDGLKLQTRWLLSMTCERGTAELYLALGRSFPLWRAHALFEDGAAQADHVANRFTTERAGRYLDALDQWGRGARGAAGGFLQANRNLADYVLSTAKLKGRADPFFQSMKGSIADFHARLDRGEMLDGSQGRRLVALCERIVDAAGLAHAPVPSRVPAAARAGAADVLVIGGTGFIGRPLVRAFLNHGKRVAVLARNTANLPSLFNEPGVSIHRGDATDPADLLSAMRGVPHVVNLAHGGGAQGWDAIRRAIVGGARTVAKACEQAGVRHLVHASTIAALYLGDKDAVITGDTPTDPAPERRGEYARAKALAEAELMRLHRDEGLPVTIVRPGVVVGEGSSPFHSGIGLYNREQHALGWNRGTNPLPLVLAEDTASAIALLLGRAEAIGRAYNIVGDVRLSARDYVAELARATGRPLRFHGQSLAFQQAAEVGKWLVKRATGRADAFPSMADLRSRGLVAGFDTSDLKALGWRPVADREEFVRKAFAVHAEA